MASAYDLIRTDNEREYGAGIARWGREVLAIRYDDRTHFIFELLQNAEDALARRGGWQGTRSVTFHLTDRALRVSHFGQPFSERDVRGICGIAESTKDLTSIGRFGIGFKSVYAFTDRPEVHSGIEDFAIESYVWPTAIAAIDRQPEETVFILPLNAADTGAHAEIVAGIQKLGARTLLFLRHIDEIAWSVEGGPSGLYVRGEPEHMGGDAQRIVLLGEEQGKPDVEETWVLFSREAEAVANVVAGRVEIGFSLVQDKKTDQWSIEALSGSPLAVFFPTVLETHLGFLVQGPYRTTPSRDNVPRNDAWNQHLVRETAALLVEALRSFRTLGLLDVGALQCLPLDPVKFGEDRMFAPLFTAVRAALKIEPLLPALGGGYAAAPNAALARTQELRELLSTQQLARAFGVNGELVWLSGDITQDRTPELRQFLMRELGIAEVTPEAVLPALTQAFLGKQDDEWMCRLYEFLHGQPALLRQGRLKDLPLIRLVDGTHVSPIKDGHPQAFLPGTIATEFPTVRRAACGTDASRALLVALGLTEPNLVDDVIRNVLPKYVGGDLDVSGLGYDAEYEGDIHRILTAFATDSKVHRERLLTALRETDFVMAIDAGEGEESSWHATPGEVYLATERLKELCAGVGGVLFVDDEHSCLRGEDVRDLLEACGAVRNLRPVEDLSLSWQERASLRAQIGHPESSGQKDRVIDWMLSGLTGLLESLPALGVPERKDKARLLWEEMASLEERRGKGVFTGEYTWTHYGSYRAEFDAAFVRWLNGTAWVPSLDGDLLPPGSVVFETLGWKPNPFLLSKIRFKPPIIDQLAKEAGIEPGLLDLLKKLGLTSEADLRGRLGLSEEKPSAEEASPKGVEDALKKLRGGAPDPTPPIPDPSGDEPKGTGAGDSGNGTGTGSGGDRNGAGAGGPGDGKGGGHTKGSGDGDTKKRTPGGTGGRPFISYVATGPDDGEPDPDDLDQTARMALEAQAITLILEREPKWQRTPTNNPGFDLVELGAGGIAARWCEVKAMTGSLRDRPVGLSHTQFDCAREHGQAYWMYVVERAGAKDARIIRVQDPAGKARTFTFDHGWLDVAAVDTEQELSEE